MRSRRRLLACAVLAALALMVRVPLAQEHAGPHWTYGGSEGPEHWGELEKGFATCKVGQHQSPIDIHGSKAADVPAIQFAYQAVPLHIVNNGHTIQVTYAPGSSITVGGTRYELKQVHFHHPSEEKIDGKGSAMVAHLVHASADGKLAVVAVLLDPAGQRTRSSRACGNICRRTPGKNRRSKTSRSTSPTCFPPTAATTRSPDR